MALYAQIVQIIAPDNANAGDTVQVQVDIKNLYSGAVGIMVRGALEYSVTPWPSISFPINIADHPAGTTYRYTGSFVMPASSIMIHIYSYWYGEDYAWHFDDEKTKQVIVASIIKATIVSKVFEYSGLSVALPASNVPQGVSAKLRVGVRNDSSSIQELGIVWTIVDPDGIIVQTYSKTEWFWTGPGNIQQFVSPSSFTLSKVGTYRVRIQAFTKNDLVNPTDDTGDINLCSTVATAPTITSFTPTSGAKGTSVVITGINLTGATSVKFGGTNATSFTVNSPTQITAIVSTGSTGTITVTTPNGTATSTATFTFVTVTVTRPTANPESAPAGAVTISIPILSTINLGATVRIKVCEGSILGGAGTVLDTQEQYVVFVANQTKTITFTHNSTYKSQQRRDVIVEVIVSGVTIFDSNIESDYDDVFYVTQESTTDIKAPLDFVAISGNYLRGQQVPWTLNYQYKGKQQSGTLTILLGTGVTPTFTTKFTVKTQTVQFEQSTDYSPIKTLTGSFTIPDTAEIGQTYSVRVTLATADGEQEIDTDWSVLTVIQEGGQETLVIDSITLDGWGESDGTIAKIPITIAAGKTLRVKSSVKYSASVASSAELWVSFVISPARDKTVKQTIQLPVSVTSTTKQFTTDITIGPEDKELNNKTYDLWVEIGSKQDKFSSAVTITGIVTPPSMWEGFGTMFELIPPMMVMMMMSSFLGIMDMGEK